MIRCVCLDDGVLDVPSRLLRACSFVWDDAMEFDRLDDRGDDTRRVRSTRVPCESAETMRRFVDVGGCAPQTPCLGDDADGLGDDADGRVGRLLDASFALDATPAWYRRFATEYGAALAACQYVAEPDADIADVVSEARAAHWLEMLASTRPESLRECGPILATLVRACTSAASLGFDVQPAAWRAVQAFVASAPASPIDADVAVAARCGVDVRLCGRDPDALVERLRGATRHEDAMLDLRDVVEDAAALRRAAIEHAAARHRGGWTVLQLRELLHKGADVRVALRHLPAHRFPALVESTDWVSTHPKDAVQTLLDHGRSMQDVSALLAAQMKLDDDADRFCNPPFYALAELGPECLRAVVDAVIQVERWASLAMVIAGNNNGLGDDVLGLLLLRVVPPSRVLDNILETLHAHVHDCRYGRNSSTGCRPTLRARLHDLVGELVRRADTADPMSVDSARTLVIACTKAGESDLAERALGVWKNLLQPFTLPALRAGSQKLDQN